MSFFNIFYFLFSFNRLEKIDRVVQFKYFIIFINNNIYFSRFNGLDSYLNFLKKNFLILPPTNIGYRFTRGSKFNIFNQTRFVPKGKYLFRNTNPLTDFVSQNLFFSKLSKDKELIRFIKRYKIIFLLVL